MMIIPKNLGEFHSFWHKIYVYISHYLPLVLKSHLANTLNLQQHTEQFQHQLQAFLKKKK